MEFEWDIHKNQTNQKKHQISFEEATEIFRYPTYEILDTRFDYGETRYIAIGRNSKMIIIALRINVRTFYLFLLPVACSLFPKTKIYVS